MKGLEVGQGASITRVFTSRDLAEYEALTNDATLGFGDDAAASRGGLRRSVVPGPLLAGLFSYLLGTRLPGQRMNHLKQRLCDPFVALNKTLRRRK